MKGTIAQNFRGLRALVIHLDDANRRVLVTVLGKLGLSVEVLDAPKDALPDCDVMFVDADEGMEALPQHATGPSGIPPVPCIALIGNEAPSRLARVVRRRCASHILKPIRNTGVYTALLLAVNDHECGQKAAREIETLRKRLAGRRIVTQAVMAIMSTHRIDPDAAYERLRLAAMNRRVPIDQIASERLSADEPGRTHPRDHLPDLNPPNRDRNIKRRSSL